MGLPAELGEAAEIDGAGPWKTFFSIYLPLSAPGLAIVGIRRSTTTGTSSSVR